MPVQGSAPCRSVRRSKHLDCDFAQFLVAPLGDRKRTKFQISPGALFLFSLPIGGPKSCYNSSFGMGMPRSRSQPLQFGSMIDGILCRAIGRIVHRCTCMPCLRRRTSKNETRKMGQRTRTPSGLFGMGTQGTPRIPTSALKSQHPSELHTLCISCWHHEVAEACAIDACQLGVLCQVHFI